MRTSTLGRAFIAEEEGLVPAPYYDKAGVLTWGIGHTKAAGEPDPTTFPIDMPSNVDAAIREAIKVFDDDLVKYENDVKRAFGDGLKQHELDALVSWHYNTGGAHRSKAVRLWREGRKRDAAQVIASWNKVTIQGVKRVSNVLKRRRDHEVQMLLHGRYPPFNGVPVWRTNGAGKVMWGEPIAMLDEFDFEVEADRDTGGIVGAVAILIGGVASAAALLWEQIERIFQ